MSENIYIIFSHTNTMMGRIIRLFTRHFYNHVAIAFDADLNAMYSFSRYHKNAALVGGFVSERPSRYIENGRQPVYVKLCCITRKDAQRIKALVEDMAKEQDKYIYNSFSAVYSIVHKKHEAKDAFTCIGFVSWILNDPVNTIKELEERLKSNIIFEGDMRTYPYAKQTPPDNYFVKVPKRSLITYTYFHFRKLIKRRI